MAESKKDTGTSHQIPRWIMANLFAILSVVVAILNLWLFSKLSPLQSDISTNATGIEECRNRLNTADQTFTKVSDSLDGVTRELSRVAEDVSFIKGQIQGL